MSSQLLLRPLRSVLLFSMCLLAAVSILAHPASAAGDGQAIGRVWNKPLEGSLGRVSAVPCMSARCMALRGGGKNKERKHQNHGQHDHGHHDHYQAAEYQHAPPDPNVPASADVPEDDERWSYQRVAEEEIRRAGLFLCVFMVPAILISVPGDSRRQKWLGNQCDDCASFL
jgi:hypothetical protein